MNSPRMSRSVLLVALFATFLVLPACDSGDNNNNNPSITEVVAAVQIGTTQADVTNDAFPSGGSGAAPTVVGGSQVVRGGSILLTVNASPTADRLLVGLSGDVNGYYDASLSGAAVLDGTANVVGGDISTTVVVTTNASTALTSFTLLVASQTGSTISGIAQYLVTINTTAGTSGQIQVSLNWDAAADLDLHVETPDGEDIYYGNDIGATGGMLDLDSNAGCSLDRVDNENITWGTAIPGAGEYTVRVDLWSACSVTAPMPFVVTTNVLGVVRTFTGTFQPSDADGGGSGDGRQITQFQFSPANP